MWLRCSIHSKHTQLPQYMKTPKANQGCQIRILNMKLERKIWHACLHKQQLEDGSCDLICIKQIIKCSEIQTHHTVILSLKFSWVCKYKFSFFMFRRARHVGGIKMEVLSNRSTLTGSAERYMHHTL